MLIFDTMKRFLLRVALLFCVIAIADWSFGVCMNYIVNSIDVGGQGNDNYICNISKDDIIIMGSSRAERHYNALMIEDSLGMSCYNCGVAGNGIILDYGRLMMIKERHDPCIIICDINPSFDLWENDNHTYLGWLKSRYDRHGVADIFYSIDKTEKYKMISRMYRYNSKFLQNVFVYLTKISYDGGIKGFRPIDEEFDSMKVLNDEDGDNRDYKFDSLKIRYINDFIKLSKGAKLVFVISPVWYGMDTKSFEPLEAICRVNNIPLLDYSNSPKYVHNNQYFKDGTHLNARGANEFTSDLIKFMINNSFYERN